jgi:dephospho-CoA kinase
MPQIAIPDNVFITGLMGSGKDILAQTLVDRLNFTRLSFADAVRMELAEEMKLPLEEMLRVYPKAMLRPMLQELGQRKRAREGADYWIKRWDKAREAIEGPVVCADMRYRNEAFYGFELGALLIRVAVDEELRIARLMERDGRYDPNWMRHPSELEVATLPVHLDLPGDIPEDERLPTVEGAFYALYILMKDMG